MRVSILAIAASLAVLSTARAADINTPIDQRPTMATEIQRGFRSGTRCFASEQAQLIDACLNSITGAENEKLANPTSFSLGLSIYSWSIFNSIATNPESSSVDRTFSKLYAAMDYLIFIDHLKKLGLDEAQVTNLIDRRLESKLVAYRNAGGPE